MGKGGNELWDDSALVNAFDHAMTSYKEMHDTHKNDNSYKQGNHPIVGGEDDHLPTESIIGQTEPEDNVKNISTDTTEKFVPYHDTEDLLGQENQFGANLHATGSDHTDTSGFPSTDGQVYGYSDQQKMEYEQLVKQYYELEEQKQKVVEQLHQANYWNYQTPLQSSSGQAHQVSASNTSEHVLNNPCSLCQCQCIAVPLVPSSACALGGRPTVCYSCCPSLMACCSGSQAHEVSGAHCPAGYGGALEEGMLAAERAINSTKFEVPASFNPCGEKEKEKNSGAFGGDLSQTASSGGDFTAVLNAWYLAGFHTGRYLAEHSHKNAEQ